MGESGIGGRMSTDKEPDFRIFDAGNVPLQSGLTYRGARLAYKTYGELDAKRSNAIVYCTPFGAQHTDIEFMIGAGNALDPTKYFIIVPNLFGNGLSSSPSNTRPPFDGSRYPQFTIYDNVMVQHRLITEALDIAKLRLVYGWSMGGIQAYHWAALFPEMVERIAVVCGAARCSPHNFVFLEGVKAALTADANFQDGRFVGKPERGLRAMGRVYAGWALSQAFYRDAMWRDAGFSSLEDFLVTSWEANFLRRDANNLLSMITTWQRADVSANERHGGDFAAAMAAIEAEVLVMPGRTDLYFPPEDSELEVSLLRRGELRVIPSVWGHYAGGGRSEADVRFIDAALRELLASAPPAGVAAG